MTTNKINGIPAGFYEGYVWMSDAVSPIVIAGDTKAFELDPTLNPFIIEARLYDRLHRLSYSVKYVDGNYLAFCYDLNGIASDSSVEIQPKSYYPNRMPGVEKLYFLRFWRAQRDPLSLNMEVLQPAETVFVGFKDFKEGEKI